MTFGASLLATGSGVVLGFVSTPFLLRWLGDDRVGTFRAAVEWVAYLTLLDFGVAGAVQVTLARALGTDDRAAIAATVRAAARVGVRLAVITALGTIGFAIAGPYLVRGLSTELAWELRIGLLLGLVGLAWAPLIAFRPLAEAGQRGYVVQAALVLQSWVTTGLTLGLAAAGAGLPGQFLAIALGNGVGVVLLAWDGLRRYPEILVRPSAMVAIPVTFSWMMFVFHLMSRLAGLSDCIVVGLVIGPAAVVVFTVTQRLLLLVDTQILALGGAAWAALAELYYRGENVQFNHRLTQLTRWTGVLCVGLVIPAAAFTPIFVRLWVGVSRFGGDLLTGWTAGYVWVHGLVSLWGWPLVTTGRLRIVMPLILAGTITNVTVSIICTFWFGVAGPAIGSAVTFAFFYSWGLPLLLRREFGTPLRPLASAVIRPALFGIPLAVGLIVALAEFPVDKLVVPIWGKWFILAGAMAAVATLYFALAWFLVLPFGDRHELRSRIFRR